MSEIRLTNKSTTECEKRADAARRFLVAYPHLALVREGLSAKARNEPKFRFYNLYGLVVEKETLMCAWHMVKSNGGAPGVDGVTIEEVEQSDGGAQGFVAKIHQELRAKTYRASPVKRVYIEKANGKLRPLGIPTVNLKKAVVFIAEAQRETQSRKEFDDCRLSRETFSYLTSISC